MSILFYKALACIIVFLLSLFSCLIPFKFRTRHPTHNFLELGDAFASGIFLGVALFHMLPSSNDLFHQLYPLTHYPLAEFLCAFGFLSLLFCENLAAIKLPFAYIISFIIILHSLVEGFALGINQSSISVLFVFLAIIVHKSSESFSLAISLNKDKIAFKISVAIIIIFSLMTPLGILIGSFITQALNHKMSLLLTAAFNALAAGTFLYISTLHHINHHKDQHRKEGLAEFLCLMMGLCVIGISAVVV